MADKKRYNGMNTTSYDYYSSAARKLDLPQELPEERVRHSKQPKQKAKLEVAPFTVVGVLVAVFLMAMVIYGYVQLYEATSRVGELNDQVTALQIENGKLRSNYESSIDLNLIELQAKQLGMKMPASNQQVYLNISNTDCGEVIAVDESNILEQTWEAVSQSFKGLWEYFF